MDIAAGHRPAVNRCGKAPGLRYFVETAKFRSIRYPVFKDRSGAQDYRAGARYCPDTSFIITQSAALVKGPTQGFQTIFWVARLGGSPHDRGELSRRGKRLYSRCIGGVKGWRQWISPRPYCGAATVPGGGLSTRRSSHPSLRLHIEEPAGVVLEDLPLGLRAEPGGIEGGEPNDRVDVREPGAEQQPVGSECFHRIR